MSEPTEKTPKEQFIEAVSKHPNYKGWKAEDVEVNVNSVLTGNDAATKKEFFGALTKLPEYKGWKDTDVEQDLSTFWKPTNSAITEPVVTNTASADTFGVPQKYVGTIKKAAKDFGIEESTLTELLRQESAFNDDIISGKVKSKKGAKGIAQFMDDTAKDLGVDPLKVEEAIPGSAKYLRQLIDQFGGDTSLGLAAYNAGPGNVKKAGNKIPDINETQDYVKGITERSKSWGGKTLPEAQDIVGNDGYETAAKRELNERQSGEADTLLQNNLSDALNPLPAESSSTKVAQPTDAKNLEVNKNVMTGNRQPDNGLAEKEKIARVNVLNEEFNKMELDPKYALPLKDIRDSFGEYAKNPTKENKAKFQDHYLKNKDLFDYYTGVAADLGSNTRSIFPDVPSMVEAGNMEPLKGLSDKDQAKAVAVLSKVKNGAMTIDQAERELDWRGTMAGRLGGATAQGVASTAVGMLGALEVVGIDAGKPLANQIDKFIKYASPEEQNFVEQLASGAGSMASFMIPGLGTEMGISKLAGAAPKLAGYFGLAVPTVMEAMTEAGSSFRDDVAKGVDEETARKNALKVFGMNIPLLAITNKLGVFAEEGGTFKRMVGSAIMEGSQEFGQELIPDLAKGNPSDIERYMMAGAIGGLLGGPTAAIVDKVREDEQAGTTDKGTALPSGIGEATKDLPSLEELNAQDVQIRKPLVAVKAETATKKISEEENKLSSTQVNIPKQEAKPFIEFANSIPDDQIYDDEKKDFGREKVPHVTALFGLTKNDPKEVAKVVKEFGDVKLEFGETSLFKNDKYDVLKVDVKSDDMHKLNALLQDKLDFKSDFPDYTPHLTIAYLKPGEGEQYVGDKRFEGITTTVSELLHSSPDYKKTAVKLNKVDAEISSYADVVKEALGNDSGTSIVNAQKVISLVPELRTADRTKNIETAKKIVDQLKNDGVIDDKGVVVKVAGEKPLVNLSGEHKEAPVNEDEPITVRKEFTYPQIEKNLDKPFKDYIGSLEDVGLNISHEEEKYNAAIKELRLSQKGLQKKSDKFKAIQSEIDKQHKMLADTRDESYTAEENLIANEQKFVVDYAEKNGITFGDDEEKQQFVELAMEHFQNDPGVREQYWDTNVKDILDGVIGRYLADEQHAMETVAANPPTLDELKKYDKERQAGSMKEYRRIAAMSEEQYLDERRKLYEGEKRSAKEIKFLLEKQDAHNYSVAVDKAGILNATNITEVGNATIKTANGKTKEESEKFEPTVKAAEAETAAAIDSKDPDKIKQTIAAIDDILLGYYTTEGSTEKDDAETGNLMPEKKFKQDLKSYAKKLNSILGWEEDTDKKGKKEAVSTNVAPAGGDVHIILWKPNSEYGIYISIPVERDYEGDNHDNLEIRGVLDNAGYGSIMYRATSKKNKFTGFTNEYIPKNITAQAFAKVIQDEVAKWDTKTPEQSAKEADKIRSESLTKNPLSEDDRVLIPKPDEPTIEARKVPVMREQKKKFGKQLISLFDSLGLTYKVMHGDPKRDGETFVKVKNEPFMELAIEAHDEGKNRWISVAHYRSQNGDTWIETEAVFLVGDDGQVKLKEVASNAGYGEHRSYDEPFANMFTKNLLEQGFGSGEMTDMFKEPINNESAKDTADAKNAQLPVNNEEQKNEIKNIDQLNGLASFQQHSALMENVGKPYDERVQSYKDYVAGVLKKGKAKRREANAALATITEEPTAILPDNGRGVTSEDLKNTIKDKIKKIENQELDDLWKDFLGPNKGDQLSSSIVPVDPVKLAQGIKLIAKYTELGVLKFADIVNEAYARFGDAVKDMLPALKQAYSSFVSTAPDDMVDKLSTMQEVRGFLFEAIDNGQLKIDNEKQSMDSRQERAGMTKSANKFEDLADAIVTRLENGEGFGNTIQLNKFAKEHLGEGAAAGNFNFKNLYDIQELAVNKYFIKNFPQGKGLSIDAINKVMRLLPTETEKSVEMVKMQQYSTPPSYGYVVADVANIGPDDVVEEPSAGVGNIATQALLRNPKRTIVNELSAFRYSLLKLLPFNRVENINAEHIGLKGNALDNEKPTVVVMNPPFSMNANLPNSKDILTAGKHIQAALNSLVDGGRLVAIVGGGMDFNAPKYNKWWNGINEKYTIKANVLVAGEAYKQKGTVFDNRLVVIDKIAPKAVSGIDRLVDSKSKFSDIIITGKANSFSELLQMLEGVKNDRPRIQQPRASTGSEEISATSKPGSGSGPSAYPAIDGIRSGAGSNRGNEGTTSGNTTSVRPESENISGDNNGIVGGGNTGRGSIERIANSGKSVRSRTSVDITNEVRTGEQLEVVQSGKRTSTDELTSAVFDSYVPQITIKGALPHPAEIVESAAMAAVSLPPVSYQPTLPIELVTSGALSDAQLENIILAGNSHKQLLPNGERRGYFIGDGTGFGKGRQISAIILDNFLQGRKKAVWFSASSSLYADALRDWSDLGGDSKQVFAMAKIKTERPIEQTEGILFVGYGTLRSKFSQYEEARKGTKAKKEGVPITDKTRIEQIVKWLGPDFDGVIAFDESHKMGNVLEMEIDSGGGRKQKKKPSQTAAAGVELQRLLPKARIVYVSATGATEVMNLAYANRLGLWGENTSFEGVRNFVSSIADSGISAMEIIAKDLKALGLYLARSISFKGVEYRTLEHELNPAQGEIYDKAAKAWQLVLKDIQRAIKINETSKGAKAAALSAFWGTQQRFFQQLLLSLQIPSVLDDIRTQMDKGNAPVIQLVSTNEAATTREIDKQLGDKQFAKVRELEGVWQVYQPVDKEEADEDTEPVVLATYNTEAEAKAHLEELSKIDFDALDISPKDMLLEYIRNSFPVNQYEKMIDEQGNTVSVLIKGPDGQPLQNPESVKARDTLIEKLNDDLRVPKGALDILIDEFGTKDIAEVTGRSKRIVPDKDGNYKLERRSPDAALTDAKDFQDDKKKILVFSDKGGTGASYHADLRKANQKRRTHYVFQAGWRADNAIQGFGRTHRSNQASKPEYVLVTTNLKAQKRFLSSIARRLDQLGALTKGTRKADTSIISSESNLETPQSAAAIRMLVNDIYNKKIPNMPVSRFEEETGLRVTNEESGQLLDDRMPSIKQFLNRMLSLTRESQDIIFDNFVLRLKQAIEVDKQLGKYDMGMEDLHADKITVKNRQVVFTEESTNAQTELVELEMHVPADKISWKDLQDKIAVRGKKSLITYAKYEKTNKPFAVINGNTSLAANGELRETVIYIAPHGDRYVSKNAFFANEHLVKDIPADDFKELYIKEFDSLPDVKTISTHMITGLTLPLWNKIEGWPIIRRAQTDSGERLIGRVIPESSLIQTMRNIGADGFAVGYDSAEVFNKLLETPGAHAVLANGWKLSRKMVQGEMRIELTNVKKKDYTRLEKNGVVMRVVNAMFDEREFYVPSIDVLNKVIKAFDSQITDAQYGNDNIAFSRAGLEDEATQFDNEAEKLGIVFNGFQQRRDAKVPMPLFTDSKEFTGTTFVKGENESVEEALQRKRKDFGILFMKNGFYGVDNLGGANAGTGQVETNSGSAADDDGFGNRLSENTNANDNGTDGKRRVEENRRADVGIRRSIPLSPYEQTAYARLINSDVVKNNPITVVARANDVDTPQAQLANDLAQLFTGNDLLITKPDGNKTFAGVNVNGHIFIDQNELAPMFVVGHELMEQVYAKDKDLFNKLSDVFVSEVKNSEELKNYYAGKIGKEFFDFYEQRGEIRKEIIADYMGQQMFNPEFWKRLNAKNEGLFRSLITKFKMFIQQLADYARMKRLRDVEQFLNDKDRVLDELVDTVSSFVGKEKQNVFEPFGYARNTFGIDEDLSKYSLSGTNELGFSLMSVVEADEAERRVDAMLVDRSDLYEGKDRLNYKDPNIFTRPSVVLERYKPSLRNSVDRIHAQEAFMHEAVYIESRKMIDDVKKIIRGSMPGRADRSGWEKLDFIWRMNEYKQLDEFLDISVPLAAHLNATAGDAGSWVFEPFEMRAGMLSIKQLKEMQKQFPSIKQGDEIEVVNPLVTQARAINAANAMQLKGKERIKFIVEYAENNPYTDIRKIGEEIKDSKGNPVYQLIRKVDAETQALLYDRYSEKYPMFIHLIDNFIDPALAGSRKTVNGVEVPVFNRFSLSDFMKMNDPQFEALTAYTPDVFVNKSIIGAMQMLARRIMGGGTSPGRKYKSGQARETGNVVDIVRGFQTRAFQVLREEARKQFVREVIAMAEPMTINEEIPDNWVELNRGISQIYDAIRAVRRMNLEPYTRKMSEQELNKYSESVRPDGRAGEVEDLPPNVVSVDLNAGTITIQPYYETKQRLSNKAENEDMDFFKFFQEARMMKSERYKLPKRVVEVAVNFYATHKMQEGLLRKVNRMVQESALSLLVHPGTFVINYNTNKLFTIEAMGRKAFAGILKLPLSIYNTDFAQSKITKAAEAAADAEKLEQGSYMRSSFIQQYKDKYKVDAASDFEMIKQLAAASVKGTFLGIQQKIGTDFAKEAEELIPGLMFKESTVFADISPDPYEGARSKFERGDISGAMLTLFGYGNIDIKSKQRYAVAYLKAKVNRMAAEKKLTGADRTKFIADYFKNIGINDRVEAMKASEWEYLNYRDIPVALNNFQRKGWSRLFVPFIRFGFAYGIKQKDKVWDNGLRILIDPKKSIDERANGFANLLWASMIDLGLAGILRGAFGGGDDDDEARKNIGTSQIVVTKSDGSLGKKTLDSELNTANRLNVSRNAPEWFKGWLYQTGIIKADEDAWLRLRNYPMLYVPMLGMMAGDDMKRYGAAEGLRTYLNGMMDLTTDFFNLGIGFTLPSKAFQEISGLTTNPLDKYSSNIPMISYTMDNALSSFVPFGRQADEIVLMLDPVPRRLTESKKLGYNLTPFEQLKNGFLIGHIPGIVNRALGYGGNFPSQGKIEDVALLKNDNENRDEFEKRMNALNLLDTPNANEYTDFRKTKDGKVKETERVGFVQPPENTKYKYGQNILRMFGGLNVKGVNRERYDEAINSQEE